MPDIKDLKRILDADSSVRAAIHGHQQFVNRIDQLTRIASGADKLAGSVGVIQKANKLIDCAAALTTQQDRFAKQLSAASRATEFLTCDKGLLQATDSPQVTAIMRAKDYLDSIGASSLAVSKAASCSLALSRKYHLPDTDTARLLQPIAYQNEFAASVAKRLDRATDPDSASACKAALAFTSESLAESNIHLAALGNSAVVDDGLLIPRHYNIGRALVWDQPIPMTSDTIDPRGPCAQVVNRTHSVLSLVTKCNDAAKLIGEREVFKPTTRMLSAFLDIPMIMATNKARLGEFVDCLYVTLYEGAGKDHLRFLVEEGGELERSECDAIWALNHLRNKWLRHDPDHGKDAAIKKSWADLHTDLQWLGISSIPTHRADFIAVQLALLARVEYMLQMLLERLNRKCGP